MGDAGCDPDALSRSGADLNAASTMPSHSIGKDEINNGSGDKSDNVRVAIRVRPLNARERANACDTRFSWNVNSTTMTQVLNNKPIATNSYTFDNVFQPPADNESIFQTVAANVVKSTVEGVNGVIFAYGQTAAGKTHTMLGNENDPGITPRAISAVFEYLKATPSRQFLLRAMYIEIYNEVIRDLLVPSNDNLKIHEDAINKRVFVDAKEVVVSSVEQVMQIITAGEEVRAYGETDMNDRSSRSHTIFSLKIESREMTAADTRERRRTQSSQPDQDYMNESDSESETDDAANEGVAVRASTLSLVDLAGSERASFTKAQGVRLVEGGHINKSLLTLGNVINKLSCRESRSLAHIPYRDSKLTRLLQPALGGNARTAIICAVTPAVLHMEETLSTLKFASRAMKVTNSAKTNEFLDDRAKLRRAEKLIAVLRAQIQANDSSSLRHGRTSSVERFSPTLVQSSTDRVQKFEKMFGRLLNAVKRSDSGGAPISSPPRKRQRMNSGFNRLSALHLITCEKPESNADESQAASVDCRTGTDITVDEKEMADLRSRMFEAEKHRRQIINEVRYERELMAGEVAELVAQITEVTRQRDMAERECGEAYTAVARSTCSSIIDETVSIAMDTSLLRLDLQKSSREISQLKSVSKENITLQEKLSVVQRDNTELKRRERQGIGPVMKECRQAQSKLADAEMKLRSVKQSANSLSSEKDRLERDLKLRERAVKSLTTRLEQLQKRDESRVQARIAREVGAVQKSAAAESAKLSSSISELSEKLTASTFEKEVLESQLGEMGEKVSILFRERDTLGEENTSLKNVISTTSDELSRLQTEHSRLRITSAEAEQRLQKLEQTLSETERKLTHLLEDLNAKQSELSKLLEENATLLIQRRDLAQNVEMLEREVESIKKELDDLKSQAADSFADASRWEARAGTECSRREKEEILRVKAEEECVHWREQVKDMELKSRDVRSDLEKARCQISELECEVTTLSADKHRAEQCERDTKSELCNLRKHKSDLQARLDESNETVRRADGELMNVRTELSGKIELVTRKAAENTERLTNQLAAAEDSVSRANFRVAQLDEALSECKSSAEKNEISLVETRAKLEEIEASFAQARTKLEAKEMRLKVVETELQRQAAESDRMDEEMQHMRESNEYLSLKVEEQRREICQLLQEKIACDQELADSCGKIQSRDEAVSALETRLREIKNGEGEVKLLRERLQRRNLIIKDVTAQLDVMQSKLQEKPGIDEKAMSAVSQLAEAEGRISSLLDENKSLKKRVTESDEDARHCRALLKRAQVNRLKLTEQQHRRRIASSQKLLHHHQSSNLFATPSSLVMSPPSTTGILRERVLNIDDVESLDK